MLHEWIGSGGGTHYTDARPKANYLLHGSSVLLLAQHKSEVRKEECMQYSSRRGECAPSRILCDLTNAINEELFAYKMSDFIIAGIRNSKISTKCIAVAMLHSSPLLAIL